MHSLTIKEASLKVLDEAKTLLNYRQVYNKIIEKNYYEFNLAKTPEATVSALLGQLVLKGDSRIKRIKRNRQYFYYLTKYEGELDLIEIEEPNINLETNISQPLRNENYHERDLHKLLSSYLKSLDIDSKTIYHEESNRRDSNQIWTHPDMVGVKFLNLKSKSSHNLLKAITKTDAFKLSSYELKCEITTDSALKQAFFQAVSNSSWANYGYLVALEFGNDLQDEMARLNESFGIGIIELNANPFLTKLLYPAKFRPLDFKTIDKLCIINKRFKNFIDKVEMLITAEERYFLSAKRELSELCDEFFENEEQALEYCLKKNIPYLFTEEDGTTYTI